MNDQYLDKNASDVCCPQDACCSRQSGRAVIGDIIYRLRQKADYLQKLMDMLPAKPTPEQDNALWHIACDLERR